MKKISLFLFVLSSFSLCAQNAPLLRFDLITGEKTVIPVADADPNVTAAKTEHFIGTANSNINDLPTVAPNENIYPDTEYTLRQKTTELFDLDAFPLRTHVRVLHEDADTTRAVFTGTMVSRKHVLVGVYMVAASPGRDTVFTGNFTVFPGFTAADGVNPLFGSSRVTAIYFLEDANIGDKVFALLELEDNLGLLTGWTGFGYNQDENFTDDKLFYKAGYPDIFIEVLDPVNYDGTESYFSYGKVQKSGDAYSITGTDGLMASSPLVHYENNTEYTTYGLLTFSGNSYHPAIAPGVYNALLSVIKDDLTNLGSVPGTKGFILYPNPGRDFFRIKSAEFETLDAVTVYDLNGKMIFSEKNVVTGSRIDISRLATAPYLVEIETEAGTTVQRFLKE